MKTMKVKKNVPTSQKIKGLDWIGTAVFIPAIVSLLLALQWGGARYNWQNVRIIMLFIIAGVLGMVWLLIQRWKKEEATIPPRLMQRRSVVGTCIYTIPFVGCVIVLGYYVCQSPPWHGRELTQGTIAPHMVPVRQGRVGLPVRHYESAYRGRNDCGRPSIQCVNHEGGIHDALPGLGISHAGCRCRSLLDIPAQLGVC